ncbi:tRNA pseudouridine(38/39) synthase [Teleopsis dalmanni]|uniref:tRNA pseudouridine(38/39) synthase n=1 Tax=Teleopsis dalmanni TaxID=139649 RepID=UPI0018CEA668|nr:tRNA pseudouridine(38/39) synthase [Teleopsis dalmanni]
MSGSIEKKIKINKKAKHQTRDELEKLSKTELIDKIIQLQAHNFQLKNILQKKLSEKDRQDEEYINIFKASDSEEKKQQENLEKDASTNAGTTQAKVADINKKRQFDFNKCHKRHVLIKLLYFGWDYQGFAIQEDTNDTIEFHLFKALTRCCLIESRTTSNYHRCGRTDKEVSAFCQVISIDLRSKFSEDEQLQPHALKDEIDYCGLLNRILPRNIQCVAWMPLKKSSFSARFDCIERTYRYYFPKGDLNIETMRAGCKLLERHTDFRNFCKMDVHNGVTNYTRNLKKADIHLCPNETDNNRGYTMYYLEIEANAFLWHQIRCIMAVLLLIGQNKEKIHVIDDLLNIETNPCKPQYTPASGLPLNLFNCKFNNDSENAETKEDKLQVEVERDTNLEHWIYDPKNLERVLENVQSEWTKATIKSTMIRNVLHCLETNAGDSFQLNVRSQILLLQDSVKPKQYIPLLERQRCESLRNRIKHYVKKQRLLVKEDGESEVKKCLMEEN